MTEHEQEKQTIIELKNGPFRAQVDVVGGWLTQFSFKETDIILPRPEVGNEKERKRAGIPVLGPIAGPVKDTAWAHLYPRQPQHGTRRVSTFSVSELDQAHVVLQHTDGPKDFLGAWLIKAEMVLINSGLRIAEIITNLEAKPRERAVAFHPYFNAQKGMANFRPETLDSAPPLDESRFLPAIDQFTYQINTGIEVAVNFTPTPFQIVDWRASDKYRCLEPWWAKIGTGTIFGPLETKLFALEIKVGEEAKN